MALHLCFLSIVPTQERGNDITVFNCNDSQYLKDRNELILLRQYFYSNKNSLKIEYRACFLTMVGVAQLVERWIVIPVVVGSIPIVHPIQ